jgi:hypothetical protein
MPLPRDETTPPVTKMNLTLFLAIVVGHKVENNRDFGSWIADFGLPKAAGSRRIIAVA